MLRIGVPGYWLLTCFMTWTRHCNAVDDSFHNAWGRRPNPLPGFPATLADAFAPSTRSSPASQLLTDGTANHHSFERQKPAELLEGPRDLIDAVDEPNHLLADVMRKRPAHIQKIVSSPADPTFRSKKKLKSGSLRIPNRDESIRPGSALMLLANMASHDDEYSDHLSSNADSIECNKRFNQVKSSEHYQNSDSSSSSSFFYDMDQPNKNRMDVSKEINVGSNQNNMCGEENSSDLDEADSGEKATFSSTPTQLKQTPVSLNPNHQTIPASWIKNVRTGKRKRRLKIDVKFLAAQGTIKNTQGVDCIKVTSDFQPVSKIEFTPCAFESNQRLEGHQERKRSGFRALASVRGKIVVDERDFKGAQKMFVTHYNNIISEGQQKQRKTQKTENMHKKNEKVARYVNKQFQRSAFNLLEDNKKMWFEFWQKHAGVRLELEHLKLHPQMKNRLKRLFTTGLFYVNMIRTIIPPAISSQGHEPEEKNHEILAIRDAAKILSEFIDLDLISPKKLKYRHTLSITLWRFLNYWLKKTSGTELRRVLMNNGNTVSDRAKTFFNDLFSHSIEKISEKVESDLQKKKKSRDIDLNQSPYFD